MRWQLHVWRHSRHHLFKGSAFVVTAILFVLVFIVKPKWINYGLDLNVDLIKWVGAKISLLAPGWGDSFEAFTRFFNFERIMLFGEAVAVVKLIMLGAGWTFRVCAQRTRDRLRARRGDHSNRK